MESSLSGYNAKSIDIKCLQTMQLIHSDKLSPNGQTMNREKYAKAAKAHNVVVRRLNKLQVDMYRQTEDDLLYR